MKQKSVVKGTQQCQWCKQRLPMRFLKLWNDKWECKSTGACDRRARARFGW